MEVVEISREERDVYLIPQNFVDTGTILGGTVKLRNAVEAAVLAVGSAVPLFYLPLAFNIRLMIVIAVSVPLAVFGVVGFGGDSLTQFVAHWFRFMKRRRIVTPTQQGNLEANRHRHLRLISKRYRVVYYDDSDTLPHNAQVLQRKADRHGKLVKRQTLYDLLPIEKIENGILHTTDERHIKILEIEPINFLLRSPREQRSVIYSFASLLKVSPVRLQFKSFSRKADVNAYLDKLRRDAANEPDAAVRKRHMSYIRFVKRLGSRDAVSRRFFVIFQYEAPTNERNISYAEIVSTLETTARNFRTYLAQCGNAIVGHENEDEFLTDVFYTLLNRRTAVQVPLQERIQDVLASYLAQNDTTALDKIPPAAFMIPPSLDLKHGRYLYMDGTYHAYLMIPADGYRAQVTAGWMALLVNAGEGIDVDLFLERQPKERMMQKIGQQIRIKDGKLAFSNLYLGRYYLVERATGIVIPVNSNGQYYLSGQYPLLNKKLEPTGRYASLASNGTEYTDYVYCNQYSAVAESRALDGSKTYDGYYLSFAKGYLCDEVNHYQSLTYADESTYVVRTEDQTQDEVLKSGFSLQKLVSTTGQPSPAIKLGGAGFKVYRVSLLSKADQFTKNADGSYDAASILEAYRKSSYDQDTLKFDFSNEEQAVATMYESDTTSVTRYNATLTADSDFANGQGLGWVPTNNAQEYRLSEIFTNEEGILRVQGLPNGQYIVVETTVPKDVFQAEPFLVTVNASSPQSSFTMPAGSITTPSGSYMTYNILDEELEGYLQLVKIDIETGKPVKIADTAFNLYYIAEDGRETLVEMNDPKSGNAWAKTSTFYTDSNGEMKTPEKLPLGKYRIVEVEGPHGYFNDRQYNVVFELTSDRVYQVSGGSADGMDDYVITESYYNHETLGQIKIRKIGNVLTGYENGQFVYESDNLANATYEIHAQGDIPTPDNQGTLWYADGDLVATVTTAEDGQVDEVRFSPTRTTATYDFLKVTHDGTKGEVAITLPLGTYTISEVQAPYGFVHTDHTYTVVLDWDNQYNNLVLAKTIIDHTQDGDVVYDYSIINVGNASAEQIEKQVLVFENARVLPVVEEGKVGVGLYKLDRDTCDLTDEAPYADGCKTCANLLNGGSNRADIPADAKMVAGAVYELYTADDIYSISGKLLAAADTLLGTATTDENGLAYFDVDVPLRGEHYGSSDAHDWTTNSGRYYLREVSVSDGYLIEQSKIPVEFTYENQFIAWQVVDCLHSDKQTTVEIDKRAFTSDSDDTFALPGATLTVTDWNGNVVDSWESSDTARVIRGLHLSHDFAGNRDTTKIYTLSETRPADGYTTARSIQFRLEQATGDNSYLQETAVWVLHESEDAEYQSGSIISPTAFSDDSVATIPAKLRAFWDKLLGKNPDADGVVIANWYCVNGMLVVNFTDAANDRAIAKCLRESDFSDLTFDKVYLTGAAAPAFFADKQVADKPTDAEITYSASWILLKDSDGFSQTVTMLDAPTRVKISKADITTHEEIPGATLRVLDKNGNVVDEWVSENTPHYIEAVLVAGETYTLEETLVPDNSGYVPANAVQFTVEDDGEVQHVFMQDDYTKVQISKTDIATGKEISGAKLKITDADGKIVAEWVTDGAPHYMERIPMGTYTLTETMAPTEQGYVRAESVTFEVGSTGDIQRVDMKDDFTKVEISKADMTDGLELPGAKLKITDASGNTIAEWETNGQPHRIERLKPGEYTLTETAAPAGYLLSEEVHFTVRETGEIQKVTMYDAPAHSLILTKRDIVTNAKLADARLTIRDAYGTTIDRWTTTDGDHAIRVLPERSAAKDPHKNLLLLSDDTSEHVYTMVEELAPDGYLVAESITFKVMQMNDALVVFIWQDGGWQKSSEGYLAMYDERTDTPVPLMKTFPQTGSIL